MHQSMCPPPTPTGSTQRILTEKCCLSELPPFLKSSFPPRINTPGSHGQVSTVRVMWVGPTFVSESSGLPGRLGKHTSALYISNSLSWKSWHLSWWRVKGIQWYVFLFCYSTPYISYPHLAANGWAEIHTTKTMHSYNISLPPPTLGSPGSMNEQRYTQQRQCIVIISPSLHHSHLAALSQWKNRSIFP